MENANPILTKTISEGHADFSRFLDQKIPTLEKTIFEPPFCDAILLTKYKFLYRFLYLKHNINSLIRKQNRKEWMEKDKREKINSTAIILGLFILVTASRGQVVGSKHNLSLSGPGSYQSGVDICAFCHTPHQAPDANAQDPLWNHTLSLNAVYGVYSSITMDSTPEELGQATAGSATVSHLCLSCHDGTVALGDLYNQPNSGGPTDTTTLMTGSANLETDLSNDHPVHLLWTHQTDMAGLCANCHFGPPDPLPFFNGYIECATCHDPHNTNGFEPFLRKSQSGSNLCLQCHGK